MGWRRKPRDIQRRAGGGLVLNDRVYVNSNVCDVKSVHIVTISKQGRSNNHMHRSTLNRFVWNTIFVACP